MDCGSACGVICLPVAGKGRIGRVRKQRAAVGAAVAAVQDRDSST